MLRCTGVHVLLSLGGYDYTYKLTEPILCFHVSHKLILTGLSPHHIFLLHNMCQSNIFQWWNLQGILHFTISTYASTTHVARRASTLVLSSFIWTIWKLWQTSLLTSITRNRKKIRKTPPEDRRPLLNKGVDKVFFVQKHPLLWQKIWQVHRWLILMGK